MSTHALATHAARNNCALRQGEGRRQGRAVDWALAVDADRSSQHLAEQVLRQRVKAELRKRMRGLRHALPLGACAERSAKIVTRLSSLDSINLARAVALFWPIEQRHEVDLRAFDARVERA